MVDGGVSAILHQLKLAGYACMGMDGNAEVKCSDDYSVVKNMFTKYF